MLLYIAKWCVKHRQYWLELTTKYVIESIASYENMGHEKIWDMKNMGHDIKPSFVHEQKQTKTNITRPQMIGT